MNFEDKYKKEDLEKLIFDEKLPYTKIGEIYGVSDTYIKKACKKLGITTPIRKKFHNDFKPHNLGTGKSITCLNCGKIINNAYNKQKFCCKDCFNKHKVNIIGGEYIDKWKNGEVSGLLNNGYSLSKIIRNYLFKENNNKCEKCNWGEINEHTNLIPLQIHHIDGDCTNNKLENLQLLCPNCHSLTENFGSNNKVATMGRSKYFKKDKQKKKNR
jgi:Zn finger protein HypA/HybF involved in hydrogenase expression